MSSATTDSERVMTVRINKEIWRRLRQAALDNDTTAASIIRQACSEWLAANS